MTRRRQSTLAVGCATVSMCWSCAGQIAQTSEAFDARATRVSSGALVAPTLRRRDIAAFDGRPLADALAQLRPDWLRPSPLARETDESTRPVVYMNDVPGGDARSLQSIPSDAVVEVQLLSAGEARIRFGPACRCPAGVIRVQTRGHE